jgi:hypothetical protein
MTGFIPEEGDTTGFIPVGRGHDGVHTIRRDGYSVSAPNTFFATFGFGTLLDLFESFLFPRLVVIIYI